MSHRPEHPSGTRPVRYAATTPVAAAQERFPSRRIGPDATALHLVQLQGPPAALHLTHQTNLDALELDDRINTGRLDRPLPLDGDPLLVTCRQPPDAVFDWWDETRHRSSTEPGARRQHAAWRSPRPVRGSRYAAAAYVTPPRRWSTW